MKESENSNGSKHVELNVLGVASDGSGLRVFGGVIEVLKELNRVEDSCELVSYSLAQLVLNEPREDDGVDVMAGPCPMGLLHEEQIFDEDGDEECECEWEWE